MDAGIYIYFLTTLETVTKKATVIVLIVTFLLSFTYFKFTGIFKKKRYPNGPWGFPIVGHIPLLGSDTIAIFAKWRALYGDVYRIRFGSWITVIVNGYQAIKEAADKPDDTFSSRPAFLTQKVMTKVNGKAFSFGAFNQSFKRQRKYTAAAMRLFTHRYDTRTEEMISSTSADLVRTLLSKNMLEPVDITSDIRDASVTIVYQLLYGVDKHKNAEQIIQTIVEGAEEVSKMSSNGNLFDVMPWLRFIMPWKLKPFTELLSTIKEARLQNIKKHKETFSSCLLRDITDFFLDVNLKEQEELNKLESERLTKTDLLSTLYDLGDAGFDTTHHVLHWLMLYMAAYPDVQKRVQSEIDEVVGDGRCVRLDDRGKLVYTEATIWEVLRITTLVPFGFPKSTVMDTALNGFDIDEGTVVFYNLHSVSFDKEFWDDPDMFRPSRLITPESNLDRFKCARILTFGIGRRKCVGEQFARMTLFMIFASILQRCSVIKPEGVDLDLTPIRQLVYIPKEFKVFVKER